MNELNRYYREVRSCLPCSRKQKNSIMEQLQSSIQDYWEQNPGADAAQIRAHFGTPEAIAASYVDEMDTGSLLRNLHIRRKIITIIASVMAVILALWIGVVGWAVVKELNSDTATFEEDGITVIE